MSPSTKRATVNSSIRAVGVAPERQSERSHRADQIFDTLVKLEKRSSEAGMQFLGHVISVAALIAEEEAKGINFDAEIENNP